MTTATGAPDTAPRSRLVSAWVLLVHATTLGWTIAGLLGAPRSPVWVVILGILASCASGACLLRLQRPTHPKFPPRRWSPAGLIAALTGLLVISPPAMLSIGLANLYTVTVTHPVPATVLWTERVRSGRYSYTWDATVDIAGRPSRISTGATRPEIGGRVTARIDPTGFAAPRGNTTRTIDVIGPLLIGLGGLGVGWYLALRSPRRPRRSG